jgi:UTP--glucose-1-phosphate uridylyltransferase
MQNFEQFLKLKGVRDLASKIFLYNLSKLSSGNLNTIKSSEITPLERTDLIYEEKTQSIDSEKLVPELKKVVIIKLNGGLGTSMGLEGPKSTLIVKDNLNFLEITCNQVLKFREKHSVEVPLIFMNSFNTDSKTKSILAKLNFKNQNLPTSFNENKSPKIRYSVNSEGKIVFEPASYPSNPDLEWAPPGHADIYPSLYETGLLDELILKGYEYLFISNVDNLGASLNYSIFEKYLELESDFVMEVALRTENDRKGGHLAFKDGRLILREVAQVSKEDEEDFQDFNKYKFFNTNSIWVKTKALKNLLEENKGILDLPIISNEKNINPSDPNSEKIIQLETAMGSAISLFDNSKTILVPPKRFIPVKNTNNLLYLLSDLVYINSDYELFPSKNIKIYLNSQYYKNVSDFFERFKVIPSLKNCTSLIINTDKYFNKPETLTGDVLI